MLKRFCCKKGQGVSAEYVIMIALVSIAIVGMTIYVRRTLQGRYRDANQVVYMRAADALNGEVMIEYEPYYVNTATETDSSFSVEEKAVADGIRRIDSLNRNADTFSTQLPF